MSGPLEGISVIDCSALAPGPYATQLLADLGADVLLIERPSMPDEKWRDAELRLDSLRRGKRSVVLDLKDPLAPSVVAELVADADVFVEGWRPGVAERLGVGYEALTAVNTDLVYCSITGYGQTGVHRDRVGHDINYLAMSGLLGTVGQSRSGPVPPLNLLADFAGGGLSAAFAISVALLAREIGHPIRSPLDVSMTDSVISFLGPFIGRETLTGEVPPKGGHLLGGTHPLYRCYECADGAWLSVAPLEERFRVAFLNGIGRADLVSVINSVDARDWLADEIASVIKEQTCAYWVAKLGDTSCVAPVVALNELADHGLGDRLKVVEYEGDAVAQPVGVPGFHYRQTDASWLGPVRGEHTDNVLRSVGYLEAPGVGLRRSQSAPSGS